jgi:hypothetical protein
VVPVRSSTVHILVLEDLISSSLLILHRSPHSFIPTVASLDLTPQARMKFSVVAVAALAQTAAVQASSAYRLDNRDSKSSKSCYCFPGDVCWPSANTWAQLNATTSGRLIATTPIGSPCHAPNYDADACAVIQSGWTSPQIQ